MKYRKKPLEIEAIQWKDLKVYEIEEMLAISEWVVSRLQDGRSAKFVGDSIEIETLEGIMTARPGDWIICGVEGELYPCKPSIFDATYESVE